MIYEAKSIDPSTNRFRFYTMQLEKNLFQEYILTCIYGRIGQAGCTKVYYGNKKDCIQKFREIKKLRKKRGYIEKSIDLH